MKKFEMILMILFGIVVLGLASCSAGRPDTEDDAGIPNPASVYCDQKGGRLDFREDSEGGVQGFCLFADGSECEEWAYFRGECAPASQKTEDVESGEDTPAIPTEPVQAPEFSAEDYQGWWTYQNANYGFSLILPEDWAVEETSTSDPLMSGHFLRLHPRVQAEEIMNIRVSVRRVGEETLLWPTGVGEGEFVPLGTLEVAGQLARRIGFQCPAGAFSAVWYQGPEETGANIQAGDLEFGFIASLGGETCRGEANLEGKTARLADMIIASLSLP
jgi:putative hemolysin